MAVPCAWRLLGCLLTDPSEEPRPTLAYKAQTRSPCYRSPFHADIFRSFSWSVNICGRKTWLFFPPGQEEALRDCHGNLPYDVTSSMILDAHLHPRLQPTTLPLEVIQEAGEMVFVPSGWHHQVHNLVRTGTHCSALSMLLLSSSISFT
jgi:hypothetical protein